MVSINISPSYKDKRWIPHILYDPENPISLQIQENKATLSLILLVFAVWHVARVWQPIIEGHSWHRSIYMWKQYLHYEGHKMLGRRARTRHEKMKLFQGLPYKVPAFTKTVITWSFGFRFEPTSTQNARDERGNLEKTSGLYRMPGGPSNSVLSWTFRPW